MKEEQNSNLKKQTKKTQRTEVETTRSVITNHHANYR